MNFKKLDNLAAFVGDVGKTNWDRRKAAHCYGQEINEIRAHDLGCDFSDAVAHIRRHVESQLLGVAEDRSETDEVRVAAIAGTYGAFACLTAQAEDMRASDARIVAMMGPGFSLKGALDDAIAGLTKDTMAPAIERLTVICEQADTLPVRNNAFSRVVQFFRMAEKAGSPLDKKPYFERFTKMAQERHQSNMTYLQNHFGS